MIHQHPSATSIPSLAQLSDELFDINNLPPFVQPRYPLPRAPTPLYSSDSDNSDYNEDDHNNQESKDSSFTFATITIKIGIIFYVVANIIFFLVIIITTCPHHPQVEM
jgi:hypothetical protein